MKNLGILFFALLLSQYTAIAQKDCNTFYPFTMGSTFQMTSYDAKGKPAAIVDYVVTKVSQSDGKEIATVASTIKDEDGKSIADTTFDVSCDGELISMDFKSMVNPQIFEQYKDMDVKMSGTNLEFPNNLSAGQSLPDASLQIQISMGGINMNVDTTIQNRKVEGTENITTPAGSFDCYVITYDSAVKAAGINQTTHAKQWLAKGVGMVKQENYNKKGKVSSSSVLTKFSK
ncbi:hypothetical protein K8352_03580 [Flavobacteriaceae bacterium F89]|uniref:DUF3108 domain-containing protein n=1 Tax=Cerina litoralis TaxID=2874477 RepID=A0AAE3EUD9_9FLAO|nr:hypothetical protein [Cerina litoralis]MCG2459817.1 hypothetical protein [Cerina litoralis]